jgi:hypothetical protein
MSMKKALLSVLSAVLMCVAVSLSALAQTKTSGEISAANRSGASIDVDQIIRTFTQKETEFRKALNEYEFKRDAVIQTIAWGGQISGEYHRTSRFVFDDSGNRFEKILFFPMPSISEISVTPEDIEDLGGVQAFALETSKIGEYNFAYVGKEKIDELNTYVFDVTPKLLSDSKRLEAMKKAKQEGGYFQGRIWVDDQDLQIVKARGKSVPEFKQRFATFETYREQIDGKYWFPTYTYSDDELVFGGHTVHFRMRIKFTDFQRLRGRATVVEEGKPGEAEETKPAATPPTVKPKP